LAPLLGRTEFVRADIRNPLIAKVIAQARVTTVVHAALVSSPRRAGGRVPMQEVNVIGTMQLLAACQKSDSVNRIVLKSTTAVYGCGPTDPAVLTEDMEAQDSTSSAPVGYAKDALEVESYLRGFARRRPDVSTTVLRLAPVVGPDSDSALCRYLSPPVVPTPLGFDPRVQVVHETDAVETLRLATVSPRPGVLNVAGDGAMPLSQILRRAERTPLPVPRRLLGLTASTVGNSGLLDLLAEEPDFLGYGRVVDTSRLRTDFGYEPRFTTAETLQGCLPRAPRLPRVGPLALRVGSQLLAMPRTDGSPLVDAGSSP
jgi:UDP-glucose 4-epimerase